MYNSEADVCNAALYKVGGARIISLTDDSREARLCKDLYPKVRDRLLRAHPWGFALRRVTLAELPTVPEFEFAKAHQLPADCLRVFKMQDDEIFPWRVEGKTLVTDCSVAKIKYVRRFTDVSQMPDDFCDALAGALAVELSYVLTDSETTRQTVAALADRALRSARTYNAQEGTGDRFYADEWVNTRRS